VEPDEGRHPSPKPAHATGLEAVGDDEIYRLVHRPVLYVTADSRLVLGGDDIPAIWQAIR